MKKGNDLDYIYILLYTGFLISLILWTAQKFGIKKFERLSVIALLAPLSDALKKVFLLKINSAIETNSPFTQYIHPLHIIPELNRFRWR